MSMGAFLAAGVPLVAAVASAHFAVSATRSGRWGFALGWLVVFAASGSRAVSRLGFDVAFAWFSLGICVSGLAVLLLWVPRRP